MTRHRNPRCVLLLLATLAALAGCTKRPEPAPEPVLASLPELQGNAGAATPRVGGRVGTPDALPPAVVTYGEESGLQPSGTSPGTTSGSAAAGDIALDFADTDIREVVAQILGTMLRVNYAIDPAVRGSVTLKTVRPLARAQLLPVLQAILAQSGASLVQAGSLYKVVPAAAAGANLAPGGIGAGSMVVPLRYAAAEDLAKLLQPYVGQGGKLIADPGRNALIIAGEPEARDALIGLVRAFDIDILAGQSYALFPVTTGGVKDFVSSLQDAFRSQSGGALAGLVRVVPMERINAVLVISTQHAYINQARRVYDMVDRARRQTLRSWHVLYLQNSTANDVANLLQQAFTPNNVTAQPSARGGAMPSARNGMGAGIGGGVAGGAGIGGGAGGAGLSGTGFGGAGGGSAGAGGGLTSTLAGGASAMGAGGVAGQQAGGGTGGGTQANPLLGGLDVLGVGGSGGSGATAGAETMRIIPNEQNNALLIFATLSEEETIQAMLRKIDILPLQVRIDATIAEVTLNDNLQYGTQFFFKGGGINTILNATTLTNINPAAAALNATFPGFFVGGQPRSGVNFAIQALQAVTKVNVLSSPQLLVLDNQSARLQVGNLVPYLTQNSQSTITPNAPVINSIAYQPTGVIMQITPRVNAGGLVTLDIAQEVSDVDTSPAASGIDSPTFLERNVVSRVVVQDGQTIGLAGLIRDSTSRGNQGIPWLKDIPLLGFLGGQQNNQRTRTELIVLITPHVLHDQRDARALTQDLREQLPSAALVPQQARAQHLTGSPDPGRRLRHTIPPPQ